MNKKGIDFITISPLLLLIFLPISFLFSSHLTQTAVHPEIVYIKYFAIPLVGFSFGCTIFLGMIRNGWKMSDRWLQYVERYQIYIVITINCIFIIFFSVIAILRYTSLHTSVFDMGTYDRKIWRISVAPLTDILYETARDHFQPILILHGFIYKIIDSPIAIQFLQVLFTISGVIPLYLISKKHLNGAIIILLMNVSYLFYPVVGFNASLDFHADHLYIPLILWAFYFAEKDNYITAVIFVGICTMVKEPLILGAAFFGLYLAITKKRYWVGVSTFLFFTFFFFVVVYKILPYANLVKTEVVQSGSFPFLVSDGNKIGTLIKTTLAWPMRKVLFIYFLFAPLMFLPLFESIRLLPAIPLIMISLISAIYAYSSVDSQYTAGIIAPAFVALIFSIKRIEEWRGRNYAHAVTVLLTIMTITFHVAHGPSPLSVNFWKFGWAEIWYKSNYVSGEHEKMVKRAIYKIPEDPNMVVISQGNINHARLAHRYNYWVFPYNWEGADYILLDLNKSFLVGDKIDREAYMKEFLKILNNSMFQIEFQEGGVLLFGRITRNMAH